MRSVSSGPLCAEVTLRKQGIPKEEHAFLIFSQWAVSEVEPIKTTTLPPAGASSSSWRHNRHVSLVDKDLKVAVVGRSQ